MAAPIRAAAVSWRTGSPWMHAERTPYRRLRCCMSPPRLRNRMPASRRFERGTGAAPPMPGCDAPSTSEPPTRCSRQGLRTAAKTGGRATDESEDDGGGQAGGHRRHDAVHYEPVRPQQHPSMAMENHEQTADFGTPPRTASTAAAQESGGRGETHEHLENEAKHLPRIEKTKGTPFAREAVDRLGNAPRPLEDRHFGQCV
jgi:hypothetical protein